MTGYVNNGNRMQCLDECLTMEGVWSYPLLFGPWPFRYIRHIPLFMEATLAGFLSLTIRQQTKPG